MSGTVHLYRSGLEWAGSTGVGYEGYHRVHRWWVELVDGTRVEPGAEMSNDPAFLGDARFVNPEQLVVAAASSCQLFSFLAVAARARIDVVAYADDAVGMMPEDDPPLRLTAIGLRPRITINTDHPGPTPSDDRLLHLCEVAHRECFIASSLHTGVTVEPTFFRR
ncbi:MAG TPA: OsmC family protein [Acidimicrobiales bacterium]|jgi:organic hydroperoxide reductase OsmC/OhrA|nr:OsmC family protein [Acidimicrobiales bacterium]